MVLRLTHRFVCSSVTQKLSYLTQFWNFITKTGVFNSVFERKLTKTEILTLFSPQKHCLFPYSSSETRREEYSESEKAQRILQNRHGGPFLAFKIFSSCFGRRIWKLLEIIQVFFLITYEGTSRSVTRRSENSPC